MATVQDLLTLSFEATFLASVLFFSLQFAFFVASSPSPRQRRRYRYVPVAPAPVSSSTAAAATPVITALPVPVTPNQADRNLDQQLSSLPDTNALAANCRAYTASLPLLTTTAHSAAKARSKPSSATIPLSIAPTVATASPKRFLLRGEEVIIVQDLPFQIPSTLKTFLLRGKPVVKVSDLEAHGLLT